MKGVPKKTLERFFKGKGINLANYNPTEIVEVEVKRISSFKGKEEAVKQKFNYKFIIKRDIDEGILSLYENINRLTFEKKEMALFP